MGNLEKKITLVTGASRGIGKGIAKSLAKDGAIVYITGRTENPFNGSVNLPGSIYETADEINSNGGHCIAIRCDHNNDNDVEKVFEKIKTGQGKIDILVNNVWGGYEYFNDGTEFWKEDGFWAAPYSRWDKMFQSGVRAHYIASSLAAKLMIKNESGLIINISYWAAQRNDRGVAYCTSKAATDKMTMCMAYELKKYNIPVLGIYPGLVRTESVLKAKDYFNLSNSESPEFIGMVISELASDQKIIEKTGQILVAANVAIEYNIKDIDGKQPRPLTLDES